MRSNRRIGSIYYNDIDKLRIIACALVFLYHLNIFKGGFLAVCTFFVLSGYLTCISALKKEKFSLKDYYINKIVHLYLPLLVFVGLTITITSFIESINWIYLKPETTSVIFGYNNFWQLSSNIDYFASHNNSPFTHLWFMAILLQYDLVFPFIFIIFKKIGDKISKIIPTIIMILLSIGSTIYFIYSFKNNGIQFAYYDTFSRIYSLIIGSTIGFIHYYYKSPYQNNSILKKIIFYIYLVLLIIMCFFIDANSKYFIASMIFVCILTIRIIKYGTINYVDLNKMNKLDKFIKNLSNITYELYLYHFLVIFLFKLLNINNDLKTILIILSTLLISYIFHNILTIKKNRKIIYNILLALVLVGTIYGFYKYIITIDHTPEMKRLEAQLNQNDLMMKQKQEEYLKKIENEKKEWNNILDKLSNDENSLNELVSNVHITGIGDSVMLGALDNLYSTFNNGYFDAKISRTDYEAPRILKELSDSGTLGDIIIIHLGTNGLCPMYCKDRMMEIIGDRKTFWINVTNDEDVNVNGFLYEVADRFSNLEIIDWNSISKGHREYFYADGIHLTPEGRNAYTSVIYDKIYSIYLNEFNERKNKIIEEHNISINKKYSFYGNDLLLNNYDNIQKQYEDAYFNIDTYNYDSLKDKITNDISNNTINKNVVIALDNTVEISNEQYQELKNLLNDYNLFIVKTNNNEINIDNITIIDLFSYMIDDSYIMVDNIHLTDKGNELLLQLLIEKLK